MLRKKWYLFIGIGISVLFAGSIWRNQVLYKRKSVLWKFAKSLADLSLILLAAFKLPRLLIAWVSYWITKPIKSNPIRITVGVALGLGLDLLAGGFLEALILLGLFSIDAVTGREGFLGYVEKYEQQEIAKAA